ncbi:MAG: hypothetical protein EZS28_014088, partial [Streblomastix strix]
DKNNNVEAREILGQTEEELDNEEDEEQERTLLEEIEHERSNVEQRISSPVGVLSPVEDQKAHDDAANAEDVARLLDPFNIGRVNIQSKSSLSLQEHTESSEVQTLSSADEEHEAPMIKENETDDS